MSHLSEGQKSPETLGETDPPKKNVTRNVTPNTENVTPNDLLETLKTLPKEDMIRLLDEVFKDR